jgi:hypothetical protein
VWVVFSAAVPSGATGAGRERRSRVAACGAMLGAIGAAPPADEFPSAAPHSPQAVDKSGRKVRRYAVGVTPRAACRCCRIDWAVPKPESRAT